MDGDRCWQRLRWLRANPPGYASKTRERRKTFATALEQAEQLVRSAAALGPETRPINLFYGISQGTRAVVAALEPSDERLWLSNHGIGNAGSLDRSIVNIQVLELDRERGAFTTLARLLGSPGLPEKVALGDLMAALPLRVPECSWSNRPRAIGVNHMDQSVGGVLTTSPYVFARTGLWPAIDGIQGDLAQSRRALSAYIAKHYPDLAGAEPRPEGHARIAIGDSGAQLILRFDLGQHLGSDAVRKQVLEARTQRFGDHLVAMPTFANQEQPCHPTVVLWAVLWVFSMLARYVPVRWSEALDVDSSGDATALEEILQDSLTMVPWVLLDALDALPDWSST